MSTKDPMGKRQPKPKSRKAVLFQGDVQQLEGNLEMTPPAAGAAAKPLVTTRTRKPVRNDEPIELFPHGISVGSGLGRPVLVLKDKNQVEVLPVWMQPLDAGVALAELSNGSGATPHTVVRRLFEAMDMKMETCVFTDIVGHHQFVDLVFGGATPLKLEKVRADEAMSFCLQAHAKFLATKSYMARCRSLDADINSFEHNLNQGLLPELKNDMEASAKKHPYVM